jgi:hypothetical protein
MLWRHKAPLCPSLPDALAALLDRSQGHPEIFRDLPSGLPVGPGTPGTQQLADQIENCNPLLCDGRLQEHEVVTDEKDGTTVWNEDGAGGSETNRASWSIQSPIL